MRRTGRSTRQRAGSCRSSAFVLGLGIVLAPAATRAAALPDLAQEAIQQCTAGRTPSIPLVCTHARHNPAAACLDPEWSAKQTRVREAQLFVQGALSQPPGEGIRIGQLDTGYTKHPAIVSALDLAQTWDYTGPKPKEGAADPFKRCPLCDPGHGTKTASVSVGTAHASDQGWVLGVAPAARFVPIRASNGPILMSGRQRDVAQGICLLAGGVVPRTYAPRSSGPKPVPFCVPPSDPLAEGTQSGHLELPVNVIQIARGGPGPVRDLAEATAYANSRGIIVVAASGDCESLKVYPANSCSVISVGATTVEALPWGDSPHARPGACGLKGLKIDISAPGESVWRAQTLHQGSDEEYVYGPGTGTSFAVPLVAGAAALWLQVNRAQLQATFDPELVPAAFWYVLQHQGARLPESICADALAKQGEWSYSSSQVAVFCKGKQAAWEAKRYGPGILDVEGVVRAPLPAREALCEALAEAGRPLPASCAARQAQLR